MIINVLVSIILAINASIIIINESLDKIGPTDKLSFSIALIAISTALNLFVNIKDYKGYFNKLLLFNVIFILALTSICKPLFTLMPIPVIMYFMNNEKSKVALSVASLAILGIQVSLNYDYSTILLSVLSGIFIFKEIENNKKVLKLEDMRYTLKEKIYTLEELRIREEKLNYQSIKNTKLEERNEMSQKLHDKIGHTIAGSLMQLEALKILINQDSEKSMMILDKITDNLRNGMDDIRYTLRKIKPDETELGLNNLKLVLDKFSIENKIKAEYELEGDIKIINQLYWRVIIESTIESLTNMIKYSNGDSIKVSISVLNQIIRINIKDNGVCIGEINKGMGLLGIEERIIKIGGDVYFSNEEGFSTLIILKR